jgi:hypothetical protein
LGSGLFKFNSHLSQAGVIATHMGDTRGSLVPIFRIRERYLLSKRYFCLQHD